MSLTKYEESGCPLVGGGGGDVGAGRGARTKGEDVGLLYNTSLNFVTKTK